MPVRIFFCYARKDKYFRDELATHLASLERQGLITLWYDSEIIGGSEWENEIKAHLEQADIILLLVSPDFIASDDIYHIQVENALRRHRAKKSLVIPILLRPVSWQGTFDYLQALPSSGKPVSKWRNKDEAYLNIVEGIRQVLSAIENAQWLEHQSKAYQEHLNHYFAHPKEKSKPFTSEPHPLLVTLLQEALDSLTPQNLLKTSMAENITAGRELLEEVSKLIDSFEDYLDELLSVLPNGPNYEGQNVLKANRKLITISNEMRSIYRNIDRRFALSPEIRGPIDRITSICAQIYRGELALVVNLSTNPGMITPDYSDFYSYDGTMHNYQDPVPDSYGWPHQLSNSYIKSYHFAIIELNNYKIALREVIQSLEIASRLDTENHHTS